MSLYGDFRRWWASKTINFGALVVLLGALQLQEGLIREVFKEHAAVILLTIGVAVIVLRCVTDKPIGKPQ